jgi:L-alanine-DL-glutamate epimerase-like enolase superfamily enzyme
MYERRYNRMNITNLEVHLLAAPNVAPAATSSSQDDVVVVVNTDDGISGVGEADIGPWLVDAAINAPSSHSMAM